MMVSLTDDFFHSPDDSSMAADSLSFKSRSIFLGYVGVWNNALYFITNFDDGEANKVVLHVVPLVRGGLSLILLDYFIAHVKLL